MYQLLRTVIKYLNDNNRNYVLVTMDGWIQWGYKLF